MFRYLLRVAWQGLSNRLGYAFSVISTMSFTLGVLFCTTSLFYFLVVQPLPYDEPERLYKVEKVQIDKTGQPNVKAYGYASLIHFYENQDSFSTTGIAHYDDDVIVSHPSQPLVGMTYITPDFFTTLGTEAHLGRLFDETEKLNAYSPNAMLSYDTWTNLFNSDADIVGKTVLISGKSYTIVGVVSDSFVEPELYEVGRKTGVWLPWDFNPTPENRRTRWGDRDNPRVFIGKLKTSVTPEQATQAVTALVGRTFQEKVAAIPFYNGWSVEMELNSFRDVILGDSQLTAYLLMACALSMLLIATANISNLFLSRAFESKKEFAIAAAVGANMKQIRSGIFAEILLLLSVATALGLLFGYVGSELIKTYLHDVLPINNLGGLNWIAVVIALPVLLGLSWVLALISANVIDYGQLQASLLSSGKGTKAQVPKSVRNTLIAVQTLFVSMLVFVNTSFSLSAVNAINDSEVINTDNMIGLSLTLDRQKPITREEARAWFTQVEAELKAMPQVERVSRSMSPVSSTFGTWSLVDEASLQTVLPEAKIVDEEYFNLFGQALLQGSMFTRAQATDYERLLIINDVLAERLYPNGDAVGNRLSFDLNREASTFTIAGVVKGVKMPGAISIPPRVYRVSKGGYDFVIKFKEGHSVSRSTIKGMLNNISSRLVIYELEDLEEQKFNKLKNQYITGVMSISLTLISIALAALGLYGIISYGIQLRRSEIGVRVSIGASRKAIVIQMMRDSLVAAVVGVMVGFVLIFVFKNEFNEHVQGVIHNYWYLLGAVTALCIFIIALLSILKPLRGFFKQQPIALLRQSDN